MLCSYFFDFGFELTESRRYTIGPLSRIFVIISGSVRGISPNSTTGLNAGNCEEDLAIFRYTSYRQNRMDEHPGTEKVCRKRG